MKTRSLKHVSIVLFLLGVLLFAAFAFHTHVTPARASTVKAPSSYQVSIYKNSAGQIVFNHSSLGCTVGIVPCIRFVNKTSHTVTLWDVSEGQSRHINLAPKGVFKIGWSNPSYSHEIFTIGSPYATPELIVTLYGF